MLAALKFTDIIYARAPKMASQRLARLHELRSQWNSGGASVQIDLGILSQLLHQPLQPDPAAFASVDDCPAPPTSPAEAAAWAAAAAAQLQLAADIASKLSAGDLGLEALAEELVGLAPLGYSSSGSAAHEPAQNRFFIQEIDAEEPLQPSAVAVDAVLAAALCGADHSSCLPRPWATPQPAAAAAALLCTLGAKLSDVLPPAQQPQLDEPQQGQAQSEQVQRLLSLAAPAAVRRLRPVLAASVEHARTAHLEPYTGPGNFERCVAAGQLAWLVRQLSGRHLSAAIPEVLHAALVATEDPFPPVQCCGLWALQHMAAEGRAEDLRPYAQLLMAAVKRSLAGGVEGSWPAAAAAAIAVVSRLEGSNTYAAGYHEVMSALLDQAELAAHQPERAAAWLAAAPPLFPRLGLQLVSHFARLMPLLLGWCLSVRAAVRAHALRTLLGVVTLTWPRCGVHAALIWQVLRRVHEEAQLRAPRDASGGAAADMAPADLAPAELAEDVALALWCAAGPGFHLRLMTGREAPSDELLQAVMQRVEEASAAGVGEAADGAEAGGVAAQDQPVVAA